MFIFWNSPFKFLKVCKKFKYFFFLHLKNKIKNNHWNSNRFCLKFSSISLFLPQQRGNVLHASAITSAFSEWQSELRLKNILQVMKQPSKFALALCKCRSNCRSILPLCQRKNNETLEILLRKTDMNFTGCEEIIFWVTDRMFEATKHALRGASRNLRGQGWFSKIEGKLTRWHGGGPKIKANPTKMKEFSFRAVDASTPSTPLDAPLALYHCTGPTVLYSKKIQICANDRQELGP